MPSVDYFMANNTCKSLIVIKSAKVIPHSSLAIFDLDDTLIKYRVPHVKAKFSFLYANTIQKLRETSLTHSICIFSNQNKTIDQSNEDYFCTKIKTLIDQLDVPVIFLGALEKDYYRKPSIGMLEYIKNIRGDIKTENSFFVGDAAGRSKDHSDCDLKLAMNMRMRFYTPEEYFEGKTEFLSFVFYDLTNTNNEIQEIYKNVIRPDKLITDKNECERNTLIEENASTNANTCDNQNIVKIISLVHENNQKKYEQDLIFLYGKGKFSGKKHFVKTKLEGYEMLYETRKYKKDRKCVIINCKDSIFIQKHQQNSVCIFLDYSEDALKWLSLFCALTNKQSTNLQNKLLFEDYKALFTNLHVHNFVFDGSKYTDKERKIAKLTL